MERKGKKFIKANLTGKDEITEGIMKNWGRVGDRIVPEIV